MPVERLKWGSRRTPPGDTSPLGRWETADEKWELAEQAVQEALASSAPAGDVLRLKRRARYYYSKADGLWPDAADQLWPEAQ